MCSWQLAPPVSKPGGEHNRAISAGTDAPLSRNSYQADHHQTHVPKYAQGQKVCLSARNHPFKVESHKFAPQYVGLSEI